MPDPKEETEEKRWRREELRGIFTLGLMAILVALRIGRSEISFPIFGQVYIFTEVIDFTLACWGIYAILMVLWLSKEFFSERICKLCYAAGLFFLSLSFILFYLTAVVITLTLPNYWRLVLFPLTMILPFYVLFQMVVAISRRLAKMVNRHTAQTKQD